MVAGIRFALFLFLASSLGAIDYSPWFERVLYLEGRLTAEGQWARDTDLFRHEAAFKTTIWTDIRAELEYSGFASREFSYRMEAIKAALQYRFLNDAVGDPLTVVAGITAIFPSAFAKEEKAFFYPGDEMVEAHLILGKEFCDKYFWADFAGGIANTSSTWGRAHFQFDKRFQYGNILSFYFAGLSNSEKSALEMGGIFRVLTDRGTTGLRLMYRPVAKCLPHVVGLALEFDFSL